MKTFACFALGFLCLLAGAGQAWAITTIARDFDQLVARADTVFKGTVTAQACRWTGQGATRHIATFVTFQVEETYKGVPAAEQTLRFLGGIVGDEAMEVPEMPRFEVGQKAVLFVVDNGRQFCPLVGVAQGRFHVVLDPATGRERVLTDGRLPVVRTAELGQLDDAGVPRSRRHANPDALGTPGMTAEDFGAEIRAKAAALAR